MALTITGMGGLALLGGVPRLWGPIVGVIPFTLLWEAISASFPTQTVLLLGISFLLIVDFIPQGVVGLLEKLARRARDGAAHRVRRRARDPSHARARG